MYHIKEDKRSRNSANLIYGGLLECLKKKNLDDITITDICNNCTVSRATFYRLFDNIDDILQYQVDLTLKNVDKLVISSKPENFYHIIIEACYGDGNLFKTIFFSNRYDLLFRTYEQFSQKYESAIQHISCETKSQLHFDFSILTGILVGTLSNWVKYGQKESIDDLCGYIENTVSYLYHLTNPPKQES